jgi:peptidoglycan/LPS O-acetylase OafA/YrhL
MLTQSAPDRDAVGRTQLRGVARAGIALFVLGLVFLAIVVLPFFFGDHNRSVWLNVGCMLAPLGFVLIIVSVVRQGRADQRAVLEALAGDESD